MARQGWSGDLLKEALGIEVNRGGFGEISPGHSLTKSLSGAARPKGEVCIPKNIKNYLLKLMRKFAKECAQKSGSEQKHHSSGMSQDGQIDPEPLDSIEDVARRLKCHKRTISRVVAKGDLKPIRFNSRLIRFRRSDVDAWIYRSQGDSL